MRIALFLLLTLSIRTAVAADLSPYVNQCEASLKAEAQFVEEKVNAVRENWRTKVRLAFDAKKLTASQRASAESAFATLVSKMSDGIAKMLSLSGVFHTLNMMPVLPPETCKDPKPWRAASEKSIAGYEDLLDGLLPIIDSVSEIAVRDGL